MVTQKDKGLKFLKFFVYLMGVVLMGGTMLLTYTVYKHSLGLMKTEYQYEEKCGGGNLNLDVAGEIQQILPETDKIIVITKHDSDKQDLIIIDYCHNRVINKTTFNTGNNPE